MKTQSHTTDVFQVIADPSRREMLMLLSEDSLSINSIAAHFSMSRPAVSKHIRLLENGGFISIRDIGRERHCSLSQEGFLALQEWIGFFDHFWLDRLKKLEKLVHKQEKKIKKNKLKIKA